MTIPNRLMHFALALLIPIAGCKKPNVIQQSQDVFQYLGKKKPETKFQLFYIVDAGTAKIDNDKLRIIVRAQQDIDLIVSGQTPIYCSLGAQWLDGGTKTYSCTDYVITQWQELREINGISCTRKGISIKFNTSNLGMNQAFDDISHTWLEFQSGNK